MLTLLKFHNNPEKGENSVISRTLLKAAVIDRRWKPKPDQEIPGTSESFTKEGEFWKVRIVRDTAPGRIAGCFIVEPLCKVLIDDIVHLIPGMYTDTIEKGLVILHPSQVANWILPLENKKLIAKQHAAYAVIICLGGRKVI